MPNPTSRQPRLIDKPLDEYLGYATHVAVKCKAPGLRCGHQVIMLTSELYRICKGAVTVADFRERLVCKRCKCKCAEIEPAGR